YLWYIDHLCTSMHCQLSTLTPCLKYFHQILIALMMAIAMVILVPRAEASAARLQEVVTTVPSIEEPSRTIEPERLTGVVEFRDVTFGYPGGAQPVLPELVS